VKEKGERQLFLLLPEEDLYLLHVRGNSGTLQLKTLSHPLEKPQIHRPALVLKKYRTEK